MPQKTDFFAHDVSNAGNHFCNSFEMFLKCFSSDHEMIFRLVHILEGLGRYLSLFTSKDR